LLLLLEEGVEDYYYAGCDSGCDSCGVREDVVEVVVVAAADIHSNRNYYGYLHLLLLLLLLLLLVVVIVTLRFLQFRHSLFPRESSKKKRFQN